MLLLVLLALPTPVGAVTAAAEGLTDGVFVQDGAGEDRAALRAVVTEFAAEERVVIAVFAGGVGDAGVAAGQLLSQVPADTVLLFTPDDVGVESSLHSPAEVDAAFDAAGQAALSPDTAVAARALMQELTATPTPWWLWVLPVVAVIGVGLLIGVVRDRTRRRGQERRGLEQMTAELRSRLQTVAGRIIEVEAHVTLADDPELDEELAALSGQYRDIQWSLERVNTAAGAEALRPPLEAVEQGLERVAVRVGG